MLSSAQLRHQNTPTNTMENLKDFIKCFPSFW